MRYTMPLIGYNMYTAHMQPMSQSCDLPTTKHNAILENTTCAANLMRCLLSSGHTHDGPLARVFDRSFLSMDALCSSSSPVCRSHASPSCLIGSGTMNASLPANIQLKGSSAW